MYGGVIGSLGDGRDAAIQANPVNFIRSGYYYFAYGGINNRDNFGNFWQLQVNSTTHASDLVFTSVYLGVHYSDYKGHGYSLRCLVR